MGFLDTLFDVVQSLFCGGNQRASPDDRQDRPVQLQQQQQQQQFSPQPQYAQPPRQEQQQGTWNNGDIREQQQGQGPFSRPLSKPARQFYDDNAVNSQNSQYKDLRARAHQEGDAMARCFQESHEAYAAGNGAKAKELSNEGRQHQAEMNRLNQEASNWIFQANNQDSAGDELDLHGLYVKEAIARTDRAIVDAQTRGDDHIRVIVGKGLHSQGNVAKIKPAIEELMTKHQLSAQLDPQNEGVLVVFLNKPGQGMSSDEVTDRIERDNCTIM